MKKRILVLIVFCLPIYLFSQVNNKIGEPIIGDSSNRSNNLNPLILLDNVVIDQAEIKKIDPNEIVSIEVNKPANQSLIEKYGEAAKGGVIFIKSKQGVAKMWFLFFNSFALSSELTEIISSKDFNYKDYKIIIDNKELDIDFFVNLKLKEDEIVNIIFKIIENESESNLKGVIIIKTTNLSTYDDATKIAYFRK